LEVLSTFLAFYSHDYAYKDIFFVMSALETRQINFKNYLSVFFDPKYLEDEFNETNSKTVLLEVFNQKFYNNVSIDRSFSEDTPSGFHLIYSQLPECSKNLPWRDVIDVNGGLNPFVSFSGLSSVENWGRWSDANQVKISITLPQSLQGKEVRIEMPLIHVMGGDQRILPSINSRDLPPLRVTGPETISFLANADQTATGKIVLTLDLPDAKSPADLVASGDKRVLGLGFKNISITEQEKL
jgi:hypothetical protein